MTESTLEKHNFSADRPITSIEDDLLGRDKFATSISKAISGWQGRDSLVVALHGDWGSGKSSLKNMALAAFEKQNLKAPILVEFNPWEWAGQDKITKAFFEQLASSIGQEGSEVNKDIAKKIRTYGLYLNAGAIIADGFTKALPVLFVFASVLGISGVLMEEEWVKFTAKVAIPLLLMVAAALKWGGNLLAKLSEITKLNSGVGEITLHELKSDLAASLSSLNGPVLVIIDDIDRLTSQETRDVFQLVKANADFPNIVYLLMFQRDIVEQHLSDGAQNGRDYLEKIIQVPFDIPKIEQTRVFDVLFSNLNKLIEEDEKISKRFDRDRWENVFQGGLSNYFTNLRNVYRYSSTISFYFSTFKGELAFEVNPVDLMAIECLRLFEPDVYKWVSVSKSLFISSHRGEEAVNRAKSKINEELSSLSDEKQAYVKEILTQLFPNLDAILSGFTLESDSDIWYKELRVCHPDIFARYFHFSVPQGEVSQSELEEILELSSNRVALSRKFHTYKKEGLLKSVLSQLDYYKQSIPIDHSDDFLTTLMDLGDISENETGGFSGFSEHTYLSRIAIWYLRQEEVIENRSKMLLSSFSKTEGISLMASILRGEETRREKENKTDLLLTNEVTFEEAKKAFVVKIEAKAKSEPDVLMCNLHLGPLLNCWKSWSDPSIVQDWLAENITDSNDMLLFLDRFTTQSHTNIIGEYNVKITNKLNLESVETYIKLDRVMELICEVNREDLDERQKQVWDALQVAIKRFRGDKT